MTFPTPTPPLKGRGLDKGWRPEAPPLQGRGLGWGLSVEQLAKLHERAADMRRNPTEPEKRLWRHLSNSQLGGHKFRRQSVIGWFIADFLCPQKALIVEVDGDTHDEAKDRVRDDVLAERGFRVLRVTNDDVMRNVDGVKVAILQALECAESPHPNPASGRSGPRPDLNRAGHGSPDAPEGEGLEKGALHPSPSGEGPGVGAVSMEAQQLSGISLEGSVG